MIRVENVGKKFGSKWVLRGVSFEVPARGSLALIGPSGSGKSVLLKTVAGLLEPDEGQTHLGSTNIGMLFQRNALFDSLTVEENLLFPLRERQGLEGKAARTKTHHLLEAVGLQGCEQLLPDQISGGMQKRLGIARALVLDPEIILYDEPTAGLDPVTSRRIADLILHLREEVGSTIIAVTNDIHRASQLGATVALLVEGRIECVETPETLWRSTHPALRQFVHGLREGPLTSELV